MKDLTGKRFGKLTVTGFNRREIQKGYMYRYYWNCICDCGNECVVNAQLLKTGTTKSCGCLRGRHHMTNTKIHGLWKGIKSRCFNKNHIHYDKYGGRGITICDKWLLFENFYDWAIKNGYKEGLSIDRIDNNGNYEPSNCRWTTQKEQNSNKRNNVFIDYKGKTYTLSELARNVGINRKTLKRRIDTLTNKEDIYVNENRSKRKIRQYDRAGNFIKEWNSIAEAECCLGVSVGGISKCCSGQLKTAYGYKWEYSDTRKAAV